MELTTILYTSFITLIGTLLWLPDGSVEGFADRFPGAWCPNPFLRAIFSLTQLIGTLFVFGSAIYLTFSAHWWYIFVYLLGTMVGKAVAFVIGLLVYVIFSNIVKSETFEVLAIRRITGAIISMTGMIIFLCQL